ncbi:MAG: class I mannose-6-phosphate isomerase [Microthrixaceae bacterium]
MTSRRTTDPPGPGQPPPRSTYRQFPTVRVTGHAGSCRVGWTSIGDELRARLAGHPGSTGGRVVLAVDTYPGVGDETADLLAQQVGAEHLVRTAGAFAPPDAIDAMVAPDVTEDPVFGRVSGLCLSDFFLPTAVDRLRREVTSVSEGLVVVYGIGAALLCDPDLLVYADLARRELVQRFRADQIPNLGAHNRHEDPSTQYKRAWFVDWRVADRHKREVFERADLFLDLNDPDQPKLAPAAAVSEGLSRAATTPWTPVPFFDPAPWGGQWMKEVFGLDPDVANYGWCFNCVPEENSILFDFGDCVMEFPALDVVLFRSHELLGEGVVGRFGAEFPIRFDFLDTMGGGNLSFQVHPDTAYIRDTFGMEYTQDESYYLLDAGPGASVYLGLREGVDPDEMLGALRAAQADGPPFDAERFANRWPARAHDHFLIPVGTVHCSGADSMVLEISATPYLFTFKLWDWGRMGLDGRPRPIHLHHGSEVICWDRTTEWVRENLINRVEPVAAGDGWREERTGLHRLEFIETRRHWFDKTVARHTGGTVHVLCLVAGEQVVVESPTGRFEPYPVNYAEVAIVPAAVGPYTVRPHGPGEGSTCATVTAFVRGTGTAPP